MDLSDPPRKPRTESIVPMINVVFLLLIFFLMTSQIAPPAQFEMKLPSVEGDEDQGSDALYINADGVIAFEALRGDAALTRAVASSGDTPLRVFADATLSATTLAEVLGHLTALGATAVEIVTEGG
mgnify:CR=1 FL=1